MQVHQSLNYHEWVPRRLIWDLQCEFHGHIVKKGNNTRYNTLECISPWANVGGGRTQRGGCLALADIYLLIIFVINRK